MIKQEAVIHDTAAMHAPKDAFFCHLQADGHYWRTANILSASVLSYTGSQWQEVTFLAEEGREEDEYSILKALISCPVEGRTLYTFNGTSFLIPFLTAKCKAYDLPFPLGDLAHADLAEYLRPLYSLLSLPSCRLADYLAFLRIPEDREPFADSLLALTSLFAYRDALWAEQAERSEILSEGLAVTFPLRSPVPAPATYRTGTLTLRLTGQTGILLSSVKDEKIRRYFDTPKDYLFVPSEDTAMHRSVASLLPKERTVPCTYENCYIKVPASRIAQDPDAADTYLRSSLALIRRMIRIKKLPQDLRQSE